MLELSYDRLIFSFPDVHARPALTVEMQRTLRIPDDGKTYPLPAGFGRFPTRHVDDHAVRIPESWTRHGGVMVPMHRAEAMWLRFTCDYPVAVKVAAGKINAVTGEEWADGLLRDPQDYMVCPQQPWLDGFCIEPGVVRQFVAMPLGEGHTAEEQLTGQAEHGGVQLVVYPMRKDAHARHFPPAPARSMRARRSAPAAPAKSAVAAEAPPMDVCEAELDEESAVEMGLGAGGTLTQDIKVDPYALEDWDQRNKSRVFIHLLDAAGWPAVTGEPAPETPITKSAYESHGVPWFHHYEPGPNLPGSERLQGLRPVPESEVAPTRPVREGDF